MVSRDPAMQIKDKPGIKAAKIFPAY